jgi:Zn-dependent oligopeptidase
MPKPLQNNLRFDWKPAEIGTQAKQIIEHSKSVLDNIGALNPTEISPSSVLYALNDLSREMSVKTSSIDFVQHVSAEKELREASRDAEKVLQEFWVESSMRTDVFNRLCELQQKVREGHFSLSKEETRYLEHEVLDGRRNGLHLEENVRAEVEQIKKRLSKLSIDFSTNIAEENTFLTFTKDQLAGCQDDFFEGLEKADEGKYKVTLQYPHYIPVMRDCTVRETRKALEFKYNSRCKEANLPLLQEMVELRDQKARILGYKDHADFMTEKRMAKSAANVSKFLFDLRTKIDKVGIAEKDKALLKKYRLVSMGIPESAPFENCDTAFLRNLVEKEEFSVDHAAIQQYFPFDHVVTGLLNLYSDILDIDFARVHDQPIWHEDVYCYLVKDKTDGHPIGYFYMDMFPREGKYSHAALFPLQPNLAPSATHPGQVGVCSLVCNFTKPTASKPSLLTHDEVNTAFHEMGHCLHHLCAEKPTIASFAGTEVERDFVECPSQMLENWCWEKVVLKKLSKHVTTGESLPDDLIDSLSKSRYANEGISTQRQIAFALFDQRLHSGNQKDITELYFETYSEVTGIAPTPGTSMPASFGHLCGYDASYYSYLWAEVFSADMYVSKFENGNQFSKQAGLEYRHKVLGPGGSIDAVDILRDYLGREPSMDAFFKLKGMTSSKL